MTIGFSAFHNCKHLKEIHFEKCTDAVDTHITLDDGCDDAMLIVPNRLKAQYEECNPFFVCGKIKTSIEFLQHKLDLITTSASIRGIIFLRKARNLLGDSKEAYVISQIIQAIRQMSAISIDQVEAVETLIQEIERKKKIYEQ